MISLSKEEIIDLSDKKNSEDILQWDDMCEACRSLEGMLLAFKEFETKFDVLYYESEKNVVANRFEVLVDKLADFKDELVLFNKSVMEYYD